MRDARRPAVTPLIMGVVNASLDSLLGGVDADGAAVLAASMVAGGAAVLDCGGQSLRTDQGEIAVEEEMRRVLPVIEAVRDACPAATISVDTYRAPVAAAAIERGAGLVNDPSGLVDADMAAVVRDTGADLVLAYSRATPKVRMRRAEAVEDPVADGLAFLRERLEHLEGAGVDPARVVIDPGPDLGKPPEQTIRMLHEATKLRDRLGGPRFLWAVSKKDFIGALCVRPPSERAAGTFGALAAIDFAPGDIVRVHDVAGVADFFRVRAAVLDGIEGIMDLPEHVRYDEVPGPVG
jgi:dihydropteroate synthase